jgi:hypothetical protein
MDVLPRRLPRFCVTDPATIGHLVDVAVKFSDMSQEELTTLAIWFDKAHAQAPNGLSIEFGTRAGGSALLFLGMIEAIYASQRPFLFTVDPYGYKPYNGGDQVASNLYGAQNYNRARQALGSFVNHAHWYMQSEDFLERMGECPYWHLGIERSVDDLTFAFLDGDHSWESISHDLIYLLPLMNPKGLIVVADVHKDPLTKPGLEPYQPTYDGNFAVIQCA